MGGAMGVGTISAVNATFIQINTALNGLTFTPTPVHLDDLADHIAKFSLAGVHAVGRSGRARRPQAAARRS